jgi:hypothetical protein
MSALIRRSDIPVKTPRQTNGTRYNSEYPICDFWSPYMFISALPTHRYYIQKDARITKYRLLVLRHLAVLKYYDNGAPRLGQWSANPLLISVNRYSRVLFGSA